MAHENVVKTQL